MSAGRFPYDATLVPPAPVVPVRIAVPVGEEAVALSALVDTGADCTLVPEHIARRLRLPLVDRARIAGVTGEERSASVYAARIEVTGFSILTKVAALGGEAILGRDLLNRWVATLDGPAGAVALRAGRKRRR